MYAFSQPGETGKRDLEVVDKDSLAALYSEEFNSDAQGGCGGAAIAGYEGEAWVWAALGLGALGFAMRRRALRSSALTLGALSTLMLGVGASTSAPLGSDAVAMMGNGESVEMTVESAESSWEGDLIVTRLSLRGVHTDQALSVQTLGGQVGELVQVVGHALPPQIGDALRIKWAPGIQGEAVWVAPVASQH
jgi:hypothetical protein